MRLIALTASTAALALTTTLAAGGAANAADPSCTAYMLNDRTSIALNAKNAGDGHVHFVAHLHESAPGCYTSQYSSSDYPGSLAIDAKTLYGYRYSTNYVGGGERDVDLNVWPEGDAFTISWVGSSVDPSTYNERAGYLNPNSGSIDVRGAGSAAVKVAVERGARKVTVKAKRYSNDKEAVVAWSRARVQVQVLQRGAWKTVKTAVANRDGIVNTVLHGKQTVRAVVATSDVAWGAVSKRVTR